MGSVRLACQRRSRAIGRVNDWASNCCARPIRVSPPTPSTSAPAPGSSLLSWVRIRINVPSRCPDPRDCCVTTCSWTLHSSKGQSGSTACRNSIRSNCSFSSPLPGFISVYIYSQLMANKSKNGMREKSILRCGLTCSSHLHRKGMAGSLQITRRPHYDKVQTLMSMQGRLHTRCSAMLF